VSEEKPVYFLGWDVGPWKCSGDSKDALQLLSFGVNGLQVRGDFHGNLMEKLGGDLQIDGLLAAVEMGPLDGPLILAIDAVFGWPWHFNELLQGRAALTVKADGKNIDNQYLFRHTDQFIYDALKFPPTNPPMTAVGDKIGSAATKTQYFLSRLKNRNDCYVPPLDDWDAVRAKSDHISIIEVYPGASKRSDHFQGLSLPMGVKMGTLGRSDKEDALRCAMTAFCYADTVGIIEKNAPKVYLPDEARENLEILKAEGWIFTPKP